MTTKTKYALKVELNRFLHYQKAIKGKGLCFGKVIYDAEGNDNVDAVFGTPDDKSYLMYRDFEAKVIEYFETRIAELKKQIEEYDK